MYKSIGQHLVATSVLLGRHFVPRRVADFLEDCDQAT